MKEHSASLKDCARAASFGGCGEAHDTGELYDVIKSDRDPSRMFRVPKGVQPPRGYSFVTDAHDPTGRLLAKFWTLQRWAPGTVSALHVAAQEQDEDQGDESQFYRVMKAAAEPTATSAQLCDALEACLPDEDDEDEKAIDFTPTIREALSRASTEKGAHLARAIREATNVADCIDLARTLGFDYCAPPDIDGDPIAVRANLRDEVSAFLERSPMHANAGHLRDLHRRLKRLINDDPLMQAPTTPPRRTRLVVDDLAVKTTAFATQPFTLTETEKGSRVYRGVALGEEFTVTLVDGKPPRAHLLGATARLVTEISVRLHESHGPYTDELPRSIVCTLNVKLRHMTPRDVRDLAALRAQPSQLLKLLAREMDTDLHALALAPTERETEAINAAGMMTVGQAERILAMERARHGADFNTLYEGRWNNAAAIHEAGERLAAHRHTAQAMKDAKAGELRTEYAPGSRILLDSINVACSHAACDAQPDQPCQGTRPNRFHNERIRAAYEANQPLLRKLAEQDERKKPSTSFDAGGNMLIVAGRLTPHGREVLATLQRAACHDEPLNDATAQRLRRMAEQIERGDVGVRKVETDIDARGHYTVRLNCWERERGKRDEPRKLPEFTKERAPLTPGAFAYHVVNALEKRDLLNLLRIPGLKQEGKSPRDLVAEVVAMHYELATTFSLERFVEPAARSAGIEPALLADAVVKTLGPVQFLEAAPLTPAQFADAVQAAHDEAQVWTHTPRGRGQAREGFWRLNAALFRAKVAELFKAATSPVKWATAPDVMSDERGAFTRQHLDAAYSLTLQREGVAGVVCERVDMSLAFWAADGSHRRYQGDDSRGNPWVITLDREGRFVTFDQPYNVPGEAGVASYYERDGGGYSAVCYFIPTDKAASWSKVVGVDWGRAGEPSVTVYECGAGGQLTKASAIMLPSAAVAAAMGAAKHAFPQTNAVAAFDYTDQTTKHFDSWHKSLDADGYYDLSDDEYTVSAGLLRDIIDTAMRRVPLGRGVLFPRGSLQCNVTAEEMKGYPQVRVTVASSRGMGFIHHINLGETPKQQFFNLFETLHRELRDMEPDEQLAMLHGAGSVIFLMERQQERRGAYDFNGQSMIDLKCHAAELVQSQLDKFWQHRMRTHDNKQIAALFEAARREVQALDPDRFKPKEAE